MKRFRILNFLKGSTRKEQENHFSLGQRKTNIVCIMYIQSVIIMNLNGSFDAS